MKNFTSINTPLIIIDGYKRNDLSGDYIDLYNYHILECICSLNINILNYRFILPEYVDTKGITTVNYKYDYLWYGAIFKDDYIQIGNKEYETIVGCDYDETLNWKAFCIRRYS